MMNRLKSARVHLVKFVFVLPLLAVLLLAFRNKEGWYKNVKTDTIPHRDIVLPDEIVLHNVTIDHLHLISLKEFYRRNPNVKQVAWSDEDELIIYLKNGRTEVYDTESKKEMKKFVEMYGGVPTVMVTPAPDVFSPFPPMAPDVPVIIDDLEIGDIEVPDFDVEIPDIDFDVEVPDMDFEVEVPDFEFEMPDVDVDIDLDEMEIINDDHVTDVLDLQDDALERFYRRNPSVKTVIWREDEIIIKKKDNTLEIYEFDDKKDMKLFKERYGNMPAPTPPPSAPRKVHDPRSVSITPTPNGIVMRDKKAKNDVVLMADEIVVHGAQPAWNLQPLPAEEPVYYMNARKSTKEKFEATAKSNQVFELEVISNPVIVKRLGEQSNIPILNMITKENAKQQSARLSTAVRSQ